MWIDPGRAFARLVEQANLGPRFAGSPAHARLQQMLAGWLSGADRYREHCFREEFFGIPVQCKNLWARFDGEWPSRLLLGSHYDTRPWADRDRDPGRQRDPVPGANDGGSGVALLCELATVLPRYRQRPTVDIVLFDAEDWHEVDGKEVSLGSRRFVAELAESERPDAMLILDMIGGRDLMLDVDVSCQEHDASYDWTLELFRLGSSLGLSAFSLAKPHPYKWIGCDHTAFMRAGIPSAILIDIDYPPWHTVQDLPEYCDPASLAQVGSFLEALLSRAGGRRWGVGPG